MIRLYTNHDLKVDIYIPLTVAQNHYLQHVMRHKHEEDFHMFDGKNGLWQGQYIITKKGSFFIPHTQISLQPEQKKSPIVCVAPLKPKRAECVVEKCTELGAQEIIWIQTDRTNSSPPPLHKQTAWMIEALEQSQRLTPMTLHEGVLSLPQALEYISHRDDYTLYQCRLHDAQLPSALLPIKSVIFIGPEGGWSAHDDHILKPHTQGLCLTPLGAQGHQATLRAETACLAALSLCYA